MFSVKTKQQQKGGGGGVGGKTSVSCVYLTSCVFCLLKQQQKRGVGWELRLLMLYVKRLIKTTTNNNINITWLTLLQQVVRKGRALVVT